MRVSFELIFSDEIIHFGPVISMLIEHTMTSRDMIGFLLCETNNWLSTLSSEIKLTPPHRCYDIEGVGDCVFI